jgi:hypothetical protein
MAETAIELIQEGKDITTHLTDTEKFKLDQYEQTIKKGLSTFLDVGHALAQIRDNRLYRETHKSFEKYCKDTWDLGKSSAYRKIDGYQAINLLESKMSPMGDENSSKQKSNSIILPTNERQTRPLTSLSPDDQVKAWENVLEILNEGPPGTKLTAALINKVVKEVKGEVVKRKINKTKKQIDRTQLVSSLFKKQYQVMMDIISEERNNGWKTTSQKEAIRWFETMIKVIKEMD